jgi:branched-chain amino acid transport system ATP-binding protein
VSAALRVQQVSRVFGALRAVDGVTLEVACQERRAVIGPNGAGKTTLFNLITGHLPPTSGQIWLGDEDVTRLSVHARAQRGLARTFQKNNLFLGLSAYENVRLAQQRRLGLAARALRPARSYAAVAEATEKLLGQIGLLERAGVVARDLSYGEQRQLEIALALACEPRILLLDEPTAGMSPAETSRMTSLIAGLPRDITIMIIEHDMDVVFAIADRITVLHYGRLLAEGTPREVRALPSVQEAYLGTTGTRPRLHA